MDKNILHRFCIVWRDFLEYEKERRHLDSKSSCPRNDANARVFECGVIGRYVVLYCFPHFVGDGNRLIAKAYGPTSRVVANGMDWQRAAILPGLSLGRDHHEL